MQLKHAYGGPERRRNARLKRAIPAEFVFINDVRNFDLSKRRAGLIYNISSSGCCLEIKELNEEWKEALFSGVIKIVLQMKLPGVKQATRCIAKLIWLSKLWKEKKLKTRKKEARRYLIGLEFVDITASAHESIKDYIIKSFFKEGSK